MKQILLLFTFAFCFAQTHSSACTFSPVFFCENINQSHPNYHVLTGKIIDTIQNGVRFEIVEVLRGEETRDTVIIWNDKPFICVGPIPRIAKELGIIGDTLVVALPKIDSIINNWERIGDYRVPEVYAYITSLKLEKDTLKGYLAGISWLHSSYTVRLDYETFKTSIITQQNCAMRVSTQDFPFESNFQIYPNPFDNQLFVNFPSAGFSRLEYLITNMNGQVLQWGTLFQNQVIQTDNLPNGMYLLVVRSEKGVLLSRKKLVKL